MWIGVVCIVGQGVVVVGLRLVYKKLGAYTNTNAAAMKSGLLAHESNLALKQEVRQMRVEQRLASQIAADRKVHDPQSHVANFTNIDEDERIA